MTSHQCLVDRPTVDIALTAACLVLLHQRREKSALPGRLVRSPYSSYHLRRGPLRRGGVETKRAMKYLLFFGGLLVLIAAAYCQQSKWARTCVRVLGSVLLMRASQTLPQPLPFTVSEFQHCRLSCDTFLVINEGEEVALRGSVVSFDTLRECTRFVWSQSLSSCQAKDICH